MALQRGIRLLCQPQFLGRSGVTRGSIGCLSENRGEAALLNKVVDIMGPWSMNSFFKLKAQRFNRSSNLWCERVFGKRKKKKFVKRVGQIACPAESSRLHRLSVIPSLGLLLFVIVVLVAAVILFFFFALLCFALRGWPHTQATTSRHP